MDLVTLLETTQNADRIFNGWLVNHHRLETALKSGVSMVTAAESGSIAAEVAGSPEAMAAGLSPAAAAAAHTGAVIINGGWHHPKAYPFSMEFTIVADGGTFEYSSAGRPLTLYGANGEAQALETPEKDFFQEELEYFMDCVTNGHRPERCLPEESAAAVKLTRWMVESRSKNGERIECRF